jgi:DNA-cytosine methyltransferase
MKRLSKILSLFDGMSCAQIALNKAGISYDLYLASEIDKHAIKVTQHNFPNTIQVGDVSTVHVTNFGIEVDSPNGQLRSIDCGKIDAIFAGSPCQGFSRAGKGLNFDDPRSKLFFEFVRILKQARLCNPEVKFFLENVDMLEEWENIITRLIGIQPVKINSSLVSAQNRVRLYWTNIGTIKDMFGHELPGIPQPKDLGLTLKDVLENEVDEKYYISEAALERLKVRHDNYKPQVDPDKTGTLLSGNQSGKNTDRGTTYISDPHFVQNFKDKDKDKANSLTSTMHKGSRSNGQSIVCHSGYGRTGGKKKGGTGPLSRDDGKTYALNTIAATNKIELVGGTINFGNYKANKANKANNIDANYFKGHDNHGARTVIQVNESKESGGVQPYQQNRVYSENGLMPSLSAELSGRNNIETKSRIRRLTPIECERLQGVPDNYTAIVSDTQRYKMLGNGWQVDTIVHCLKCL